MKVRTYFLLIMIAVGAWLGYTGSETGHMLAVQQSANPHSGQKIPEQAIRLRILANSDQVRDQWLKRQIRDEVIKEMKTWVHQPETIDEARRAVKKQIPRFQQIAEETIARHGFHYPVKVDFGQVPFPTKLYGDQVYPAGNYEALRITIGEGKGDNWWCVLFPPLCFVDMSNGDAVPQKNQKVLSASISPENQVLAAAESHMDQSKSNPVEVRFLFLDQLFQLFK
ncbi:stage II sporulation protein R [Paenactinomyces guangxiensis]|uniref:Stage II sporulation protein R n=1 Tax=Paenactinomyces guangxiensis TaxID=1490290 RepID=A0A7W1WU08_9BACL|nr:stage II sporulation protein R [Paenactinomyces guangxiensis]MBA4495942.1 stage II sporulation protein R [Paenactinomyces guangxiensis]MBH8593071.1 stage II sporulation protein R [Paenactinomyces guangxiensis]